MDGNSIINPENSKITKYVNPGEPADNTSLGDGIWVDSDDFNSCDRKFIMSTGPFDLGVGVTQEIIIAYLIGEGSDPLDSIRDLKEQIPLIQNLADNDFDFTKLGVEDFNSIPNDFVLYQNYPNPFNPSTKIEYSLPYSSNVDISIHNISGKEIYSIHINNQSEGLNSFEWNSINNIGEKVSTGIYMATVKAGTYQQTIKMLLIE